MLVRVKEHLDNMARIVDKLAAIRSSGSELQEQAVYRRLTLLKELAATTTTVNDYLNEKKSLPISDSYTQSEGERRNSSLTLIDSLAPT
jgi:hypothetical protein